MVYQVGILFIWNCCLMDNSVIIHYDFEALHELELLEEFLNEEHYEIETVNGSS